MKQGMFAKQSKKILISQLNLPSNPLYTLLVCGVERGGTSMVGGVLGELGIDMGPVGLNHEDPNILLLKQDQLQPYIDRRNEKHCRWGFKYPRAHVDSRIKEIKFRNPIWVFVFRNPVSNIDSLVAWGVKNNTAAYQRIVEYYTGLLDIVRDESSNYVLISYERAVAEPERFVTELAQLFDLQVGLPTIQLATKQVSGDGGGYLPPNRHYHFVTVLAPHAIAAKQLESSIPLTRGSQVVLRNLELNFQDENIPLKQDYIVKYQGGGYKNFITIIFDFGEGFSGLAVYDLPLRGDNTLIRVEHQGAVRRIGIGSRRDPLPLSVRVLRCLAKAPSGSSVQTGVPTMMFSSNSGFSDEALGYNAAGLNRMNARFRVFMEPLQKEITGCRVLDLASHDGRWSYAALKLGASHVTGIEARQQLIHKGKHLFADTEFKGRYDFIAGDIFDVMPELRKQGQSFDVVLCLGIFYHVMDHFRLMRLIRDFDPRLVILDTGLVDDEKPYISLGTEPNDRFLNAIASSDEKESVVGVVSKGGLRMICKALGFDIEFLNWNRSDFPNSARLTDYFQEGREKRRRFSIVLRTAAKPQATTARSLSSSTSRGKAPARPSMIEC